MLAILPLLARRVGDPDYWWHLETARWMLDNRALPAHDLFTYTATSHTWVDHEYLSELAIDALTRLGGAQLVSLGFGAVTWAGFWLIVWRTSLRGHHASITAAAVVLGALAGNLVWGPRTQMLTFALVCLELLWLEQFLADRGRAIYALPLVVALWSNLHAGVLACFLFLGAGIGVEGGRWLLGGDSAARRRALRLVAVAAASALAGLLNPHGARLYTYAVRTQADSVQQSLIAEWHSPDFHNLNVRPLEAMILALVLGLALRRRVSAWDLVLCAVTLVLALQSVRHIALFVAAVTPIVAWTWSGALADLDAPLRRRLRIPRVGSLPPPMSLACIGVVLIAAAVVTRSQLNRQRASTTANFPVAAADWLDAHPHTGTRMLNDYAFGGYLAYRFFPEPARRVFVFGEADLMGGPLLRDYEDMVTLKSNWQALLDRYRVDYAVLTPDTPLRSALEAQPGWHVAYADAVASVLVKG